MTTYVHHAAVVFFVVLSLASPAAVAVAAQDGATTTANATTTATDSPTATPTASPTATPTASPTPTPSAADSEVKGSERGSTDFTLQELREGGRQSANSDAPDGVRSLGSYGAIALRYKPAKLLGGGPTYLTPKTTLNVNDLVIRTARFGQDIEPRDVTMHVVYYEPKKLDNSTNGKTAVASNVSHQKIDVTLGTRYSNTEVSLWPHYNEPVQMTIFFTDRDGNPIPGARWTNIQHRSDPASAPAENIEDRGDLIEFVGMNVMLVGIVGMLAGFGAGNHILNKTISGPNLGVWTYGIIVLVVGFAGSAFAYMLTSSLLSNLPWVWGVLIALIAFLGYLEVGGPSPQQFVFEQHVLSKATSPSGEEIHDTLHERMRSVTGFKAPDGTINLPKSGIRPLIARYFASPATLDDLDVETRVNVGGDFDEKFYADPETEDGGTEQVLVHTPAYLEFDPELIKPSESDEPLDSYPQLIGDVISRINWTFLFISAGLLAGGFLAGKMLVGYPIAGLLVGGVGVLAVGSKAHDGHAEFVPAPVHMRAAAATVVAESVEYDDSKTIEEADRARFKAEAQTASELRRRERGRAKVTSQRIAEESVGVEIGADARENVESPAPHPEEGSDRRRKKKQSNGKDLDDGGGGDGDDEGNGGAWRSG